MSWAKIAASLLSLIKPLVYWWIYTKAKAIGWSEAELARLRKERQRIETGERARRESENSDTPDPYLRD